MNDFSCRGLNLYLRRAKFIIHDMHTKVCEQKYFIASDVTCIITSGNQFIH